MTGALCPVNSLDSSRETLVTLRVVVLEADLELNLEKKQEQQHVSKLVDTNSTAAKPQHVRSRQSYASSRPKTLRVQS